MKWYWWLLIAVVLLGGGTVIAVKRRKDDVDGYYATGKDDTGINRGIVPVDPRILAANAGVSLDVYAAGRMARNEYEKGPESLWVAIIWTMRNYARKHGLSAASLLLRGRTKDGSVARSDGWFGAQWTGKYAATGKPPTVKSLAIAKRVFAGDFDDPTGGATQFDSPDAFESPEKLQAETESREKMNRKFVLGDVPEGTARFWVPIG